MIAAVWPGAQPPRRRVTACGDGRFVTTTPVTLAVHGRDDMNCDGTIDFDDINPFVLALSNFNGYIGAYPECNVFNADCNGDGVVNFGDINAFVALLSGG